MVTSSRIPLSRIVIFVSTWRRSWGDLVLLSLRVCVLLLFSSSVFLHVIVIKRGFMKLSVFVRTDSTFWYLFVENDVKFNLEVELTYNRNSLTWLRRETLFVVNRITWYNSIEEKCSLERYKREKHDLMMQMEDYSSRFERRQSLRLCCLLFASSPKTQVITRLLRHSI